MTVFLRLIGMGGKPGRSERTQPLSPVAKSALAHGVNYMVAPRPEVETGSPVTPDIGDSSTDVLFALQLHRPPKIRALLHL